MLFIASAMYYTIFFTSKKIPVSSMETGIFSLLSVLIPFRAEPVRTALGLTEQERQHTETERHGDEAGNEAESGTQ